MSERNYARDITIRGAELLDDGSAAVLQPSVLTVFAAGEMTPDEPFVRMSAPQARAMLQAMIDACWDFGIRPSESRHEAQAAHLRDMRRLVGRLTEVDLG